MKYLENLTKSVPDILINLFMFFIVVASAVFIIIQFQKGFNPDTTSNIVLLLTAFLIFWYSVETHDLVRETRTANNLSIQPIIILGYTREDGSWKLLLRNIGKGAAINVSLESNDADYKFITKSNIIPAGEALDIIINDIYSVPNEIISGKKLVTIIIYFERIKELGEKLSTKVEIHNPPRVDILSKDWGLD